MLSPRRILLVLPLLFLPAQAHAQKPKPVTPVNKAEISETAKPGSPLPLSQRDTLNFKYADLGDSYLPYPAFIGTFANGQQAQFLIDTGSDGLSISDELAQKLGLSPDASRLLDKSLVVDGKPIKEVTMPDCVIQLSLLSYPLSSAKSEGKFTINGAANVIPAKHIGFIGADGIFGTALLSGSAAIFDGPRKEGTFIVGGKLTATEREQLGFPALAASVAASPPQVGSSSLVTLSVTLENKGVSREVTLLLDTGSNVTTISRDLAMAIGLEPVHSSTTSGVLGSEETENAPVETLRIGDLALHGVSVVYPSKDKAASVNGGPKGSVSSKLGMDILAGYRVLIDLPASRMYIMPEVPQVNILPK
ncbi:MAG: aspartyl protease family protein [Janthinobacterium lividum]